MNDEHRQVDPILAEVARMMTEHSTPSNNVCPDDEMLAAYVDGNLSEKDAENCETHLAKCEDCMDVVVSLYQLQKESIENEQFTPSYAAIRKAKDLVEDQADNFFTNLLFLPQIGRSKKQWGIAEIPEYH